MVLKEKYLQENSSVIQKLAKKRNYIHDFAQETFKLRK